MVDFRKEVVGEVCLGEFMKVGGRKKGLKIVYVVGFVGVEEWGEKREEEEGKGKRIWDLN